MDSSVLLLMLYLPWDIQGNDDGRYATKRDRNEMLNFIAFI
jgi:hypothetical protein